MGRGRARRHLRRQAAAVLRARAVERARPDPEGAPVRPHQQRGQPRRGRQGVLLLPRQHADALVHEVSLQVPAARVSVRGTCRDEPRSGRARSSSTSCSTPASSTTTATSTCSSSTPRQGPEDILSASPSTTAGPKRRGCDVLPTLWFRNTWSWGEDDRKPSLRDGGPGVIEAAHPDLGDVLAAVRGRAGAAVHREREQRAAALGPAERLAVRQGRVPRLRGRGRARRGQSRHRSEPRPRRTTCSTCPAAAAGWSGCV